MCPIGGSRKRRAGSIQFLPIFGLAFLLLAATRTSLAQKSGSVPQTVSLYLSVRTDGKLHKIKVEAFQVLNDRRQDFKVRVREGWRF